ncbi:MAG: rod shape-determining protein RodA [Anaerolineae bacterium]
MRRRVWKNFDFLLLLTTISIMGIGIALIYSATISTEASDPLLERSFFRQILSGSSGLLLLLITAALDYQFLGNIHWLIYMAALGILGLVMVTGQVGFGAQSWLTWRRAVQPSELVKVLLIVFLAKYFAEREERIHEPQWILFSALLLLPPIFLIYRQPDLGTATVVIVIWIGMVFTAGVRFLHLGLLGLGTAAIAPVVWFSLKDYMKQRILVFLNPASDVSGISYNARQALISIGSGGWFGKGFLHGTQSQLYFLRVRHTDYVFSVLCEEFGFIGAVVLLFLLVILLWRILRAASLAQDAFGRLIACGVATMIFFQSFVNIAVNVGLLPVTGLTLPLVSYGGSSLWATLLGIGLVESVVMRHKKLEFGD